MSNSPDPVFYAPCPNRGFIRIAGDEAGAFLQGLLTTNIDRIGTGHCAPGALLTPQGRILHDMMIYHRATSEDTDGCFIIEMAKDGVADLFTRLRRYRLRRPIDIAVFDDLQLWICWGENLDVVSDLTDRGFADPRHPTLGMRWLGPTDAKPPFAEIGVRGDLSDWHLRRILAGVPEGPVDLTPERALMLEAGLDALGAVDFQKGCYVGQEVTARTHYRGLVKRRLVPIAIDATSAPLPDTDITLDGNIVTSSKTAASSEAGTACLALLKLSEIHHALDTEAPIMVGDAPAKLAIADWMHPLPKPARTDTGA